MHIITTIYFAPADETTADVGQDRVADPADLKDSDRQWVSIYEGKNRVEPIDSNE